MTLGGGHTPSADIRTLSLPSIFSSSCSPTSSIGVYLIYIFSHLSVSKKKLPNVEGVRPAQGREKRFDRILCKEICFEGDSATVVVRGFALTYDTTGQFVEDTIPYTLRGQTVTYEDDVEVHSIWESDETVYRETFPVSYLEPKIDGIFHTNIMTQFPIGSNTDKPS